jgi:hypothetical protein
VPGLTIKKLDKLAEKIAAPYLGKQIQLTGPDFRGAMSKALDNTGTQITNEYTKELPVERTQQRYDALNDHGRNDMSAKDSMDRAIKETDTSAS